MTTKSKNKKEDKHCLTIFLLKEKFKKLSNIVVPGGAINSFSGLDGHAVAYLYKNNEKKPGWVRSFGEFFDLSNINNVIHALIVFLEVDGRVFVVTTSFGHTKIKNENVVNDFGLKVVLNKVDKKALRAIDLRKLTISSHQSREVSSSNSSLEDFDFDSNEDFLSSISGKVDDGFALALSGSDSLKIVKRFNIKEIRKVCQELLVVYNQKKYIDKGFDFVDDLKKVYDSGVYLQMKKKIVKTINRREEKSIALSYPEIEEYDFCNYRISLGRKKKITDDINVSELFKFLDENDLNNLDERKIFNIKIELLDEDEDVYRKPRIKKSYSLIDYLVFEFDKRDKKYIFIDGSLYLVEMDYYRKLYNFLKKHEISGSGLSISLPPIKLKNKKNKKGVKYVGFEDEGDYNDRVANVHDKVVFKFDKKFFRNKIGNKKTSIEICDILTKKMEFLCVKVYKNSSTALSHLFFQGSVSAELLAGFTEYGREIIGEVGNKFKVKLGNRSEIKFVFAIASKSDRKITDILPIFSKISLRKAIMDIEKMNFKAQIVKIDTV